MSKLNLDHHFFQFITKIGVTLLVGLSSALLSSPIHAITLNENLIINGNAEQGNGDPVGNAVGDDIPIIPGWNQRENFSVLRYGATGFEFVNPRGETVRVSGLPDASNPGPADRGLNLFFGGGNRGSSSAAQFINVTDLASVIDAGQGAFTLSGALGGYTSDQDSALLEISFLNQDNQSLITASIASPTPEERNNATGLFFESVDRLVPVGTRYINVLLNMNYASGRVNDAYADNLSLVIKKQVPEPSMSALIIIGASAIAVWGLRQNRRLLQ